MPRSEFGEQSHVTGTPFPVFPLLLENSNANNTLEFKPVRHREENFLIFPSISNNLLQDLL